MTLKTLKYCIDIKITISILISKLSLNPVKNVCMYRIEEVWEAEGSKGTISLLYQLEMCVVAEDGREGNQPCSELCVQVLEEESEPAEGCLVGSSIAPKKSHS